MYSSISDSDRKYEGKDLDNIQQLGKNYDENEDEEKVEFMSPIKHDKSLSPIVQRLVFDKPVDIQSFKCEVGGDIISSLNEVLVNENKEI